MYTFEFRPKMAELSPDDKRKTRGKSAKLDDLSSLSKALETYATKCKKDEIRMWQFGAYAEANKSKDSKKSPDFESIVAMQMLLDVILPFWPDGKPMNSQLRECLTKVSNVKLIN